MVPPLGVHLVEITAAATATESGAVTQECAALEVPVTYSL
jgi:hypothetical protein